MIEMSMWFYWLSLAIVALVTGFFCYWMGVGKAESKQTSAMFSERESALDRLRVLSADNLALHKKVDALEFELRSFYPENTWNNVRSVPGQPQ